MLLYFYKRIRLLYNKYGKEIYGQIEDNVVGNIG